MKDLGDWLFLIGMGGIAAGYYAYENKAEISAWLDTLQKATAPTRVAGTTLADHWGMVFLVIVLVVIGIMLLGDSLNKRSVKETTTEAATVKKVTKHRSVIGNGKGEFVE